MPFVIFGQRLTCTLWFQLAAFDESDMYNLASEILAAFYNTLDTYFTSDCQYGPCQIYDMREENAPVVVGTEPSQGGEAAGDVIPLSNAVVLTLRTNRRGKSFRGRMYVAGFTETHMVDNAWAATLVAAMEALGAAIQANSAAIGWTWCVHSGVANGVPREEGVLTPVTTWEVRNPIPGVQRRRQRRT